MSALCRLRASVSNSPSLAFPVRLKSPSAFCVSLVVQHVFMMVLLCLLMVLLSCRLRLLQSLLLYRLASLAILIV